ncbi:MAG: hypothetical protein ACE15F_06545 [bacterium]
MKKYILLLTLFTNYSVIAQNIQIDIMTTGNAADEILQHTLLPGTELAYVYNFFTNKWGNWYPDDYPDVDTTLGIGYFWDPVPNIGGWLDYWESPCIHVQVESQDLSGIIPNNELVIKRYITGKAGKAWNVSGQTAEYDDSGNKISFWLTGINEDDTSTPTWKDFSNGIPVDLDSPGIKGRVYYIYKINGEYIDLYRARTNFRIEIHHNGVKIKDRSFKLQVEARWNNGTYTIDHVGTSLTRDTAWTSNDLNINLWQN